MKVTHTRWFDRLKSRACVFARKLIVAMNRSPATTSRLGPCSMLVSLDERYHKH